MEVKKVLMKYFSENEAEKSKPKADKLKILADYFGVSLETFVD